MGKFVFTAIITFTIIFVVNNNRTERERFDSFIERIQTRLAFGWLSERSGEKTSCPGTF